jgi:hypothetical protein
VCYSRPSAGVMVCYRGIARRSSGWSLSDYDLAFVRRWLYNEKRRKRSTMGRSTRTGHREWIGWMDDAAGSPVRAYLPPSVKRGQ